MIKPYMVCEKAAIEWAQRNGWELVTTTVPYMSQPGEYTSYNLRKATGSLDLWWDGGNSVIGAYWDGIVGHRRGRRIWECVAEYAFEHGEELVE
jgi:hypothetical protein